MTEPKVVAGTAVTLSCSITGISAAATIVWRKKGEDDLSGVTGYTVTTGNFGSGAQESTLALTAAVNTEDTVFTCDVTPPGSGQTTQSIEATLDVAGKLISTQMACT